MATQMQITEAYEKYKREKPFQDVFKKMIIQLESEGYEKGLTIKDIYSLLLDNKDLRNWIWINGSEELRILFKEYKKLKKQIKKSYFSF